MQDRTIQDTVKNPPPLVDESYLMSRRFGRLSMLVLLVLWGTFPAGSVRAQSRRASKPLTDNALAGKPTFDSTCAACHGLDGRGGERGPDIARRPQVQRLPDNALLRIVRHGLPGKGMPAFTALSAQQVQAVVSYLRTLQGQGATAKLPGDPERGKALFFAQAGCSQCHMVHGQGGFIGSDLSSYGNAQPAAEIRRAITDPNRNLDPGQRTVIVTAQDGKAQTGIARNEDNFSLQLQTTDGTFHYFAKADLQNVDYQPRSLMPADYGSQLSSQDIDDLISFLMSAARE
jgi:putative heme-binding domain-containing protein